MSFLPRLSGAITRNVSLIHILGQQRQFSLKNFRAIFGFKLPKPIRQTIVLPAVERPQPKQVQKRASKVDASLVKAAKPVQEVKEENEGYEKELEALRARMVETVVPFSDKCVEQIRRKLRDIAIQSEKKKRGGRREIFKKYDRIVVLDASIQKRRAASAAIILRKDQPEPEVRIFTANNMKHSLDAECTPMLHLLMEPNQRTLFVTDQKHVVDVESNEKLKNALIKAIHSELKKNPESKLIWIPSKHYSPYKMCHFLAGFIARESASSLESTSKIEEAKMNMKVSKMDVNDTFCSLLQYLKTGIQITN